MTDHPSNPTPSVHDDAQRRLDRLETYLRQDPSNERLLEDTFDAALACGAWDRAAFHLRHGQALDRARLGWQLREAHWLLAQQRDEDARKLLEDLRTHGDAPPAFAAAVLHDLAFIDWRARRFAACIERLAPLMESPSDARGAPAASPARAPRAARGLQSLWLRALHQQEGLDRALAWARDAESRGELDPQAAGIASLAALDAADFAAAARWAQWGLSTEPDADRPAEAWVTQSSLALAAQDAPNAIRLAALALERRPKDGRCHSAHAFALLLAGRLDLARASFDRAVAAMPSHIGTWHGRGWTQILQGDLAGAHESFGQALERDRSFAESHGGAAVVLALQKREDEARAHAERALGLDKSNLSGRYAQALLQGEINNAQDLQRLARRLLGGRTAPLGGDMADLFADTSAAPSLPKRPGG